MRNLSCLYRWILVVYAFLLCSCATAYHIGDDYAQPLNKQNYGTKTVTFCKIVGSVAGGILGGSICFVPGIMTGSVPGLVISTIGCGAIGAILLGSAAEMACA